MTISPTDFASLLCSRLCHDLLSPVGAFNNGLELLADEDDPHMRERCLELLNESAAAAANKLKFFRLAFGAAGGFGESVDAREAKTAIEGAKLAYEDGGETDSSLPVGQIAKQTPSAGAAVAMGTTVKIWLSNGSKSKIPDVVGQNVDAARGAVQGAGFETVNEKCVPLGDGDPATLNTVTAILPKAGKAALRTGPVLLAVVREAC